MGNNFCSLNPRNCNYSITLKDANENLTFYLTYFQSFTESIFTTVYNFPLIEIQPPKFIKWYKTFKSKETNPPKDFSESNTVYPVPLVECLFLPEFKNQKRTALPNFKTVEMIAKGAFGKVYKVKDINTQNSYAMKILQKSQIIEENAVSQVKDELNIQKMCGHHQFIVKCLFAWQTRAQLFIVSDYKSGGELLDILRRYGPLPEKIIQIYVAELAIAIDFLHHSGVIYRDLKPENILLDEDGHICVTDFGLSKWLKLGSRTNTICGTINYIAPEILRNEPYTHAVDWWSLGVVVCRLLTNEYPVRNDNSVELPSFVELSAASKDLLKRLLEYDPSKRLRALYALKRIAFFKDFSFDDVVSRRVHPREMLEEYEPINEPFKQANLFENFHHENS